MIIGRAGVQRTTTWGEVDIMSCSLVATVLLGWEFE